jgi:hypothetical protein
MSTKIILNLWKNQLLTIIGQTGFEASGTLCSSFLLLTLLLNNNLTLFYT